MDDKMEKAEVSLVETEGTPQPLATTPMEMIALAQQRGATIEQMQQLIELNREMEKDIAIKEYNKAFAAFQGECPLIRRTARGNHSKYADLAVSMREITPLMLKHGLSARWSQEQEDTSLKVTCTITHIAGHSESTSLFAGIDLSGNKSDIHGLGSTNTYLSRYTLFSALGISTTGMDDDGLAASGGPSVEYITDEQVATIQSLLSELGKKEEDFLKWEGANDIETIPASRYDRAIKAINKLVKAK